MNLSADSNQNQNLLPIRHIPPLLVGNVGSRHSHPFVATIGNRPFGDMTFAKPKTAEYVVFGVAVAIAVVTVLAVGIAYSPYAFAAAIPIALLVVCRAMLVRAAVSRVNQGSSDNGDSVVSGLLMDSKANVVEVQTRPGATQRGTMQQVGAVSIVEFQVRAEGRAHSVINMQFEWQTGGDSVRIPISVLEDGCSDAQRAAQLAQAKRIADLVAAHKRYASDAQEVRMRSAALPINVAVDGIEAALNASTSTQERRDLDLDLDQEKEKEKENEEKRVH